jgi:hypothetical protein
MALLFRQLLSALSLTVGLVLALLWHHWADSPIYLFILGIIFTVLGIIGVVTTIVKAEVEQES